MAQRHRQSDAKVDDVSMMCRQDGHAPTMSWQCASDVLFFMEMEDSTSKCKLEKVLDTNSGYWASL